MLNKMSADTTTSRTKADNKALNQSEGASKWVWLPINGDPIDTNRLLIQIETAVRDLLQADTSKSHTQPLDSVAAIGKIANDLINEKTGSENDSLKIIEKNNANTAKADIKG